MKDRFFQVVALLLLTCFQPATAADNDFEAARLKAVAANPPGVSLTLRLPSGRTQFHQGEVIPLTATFTSSQPKVYQFNTGPGDRDLPWNSDAFQVDNPTSATDPLRVYYAHEFGMAYSGGGPHFEDLTAQPVAIPLILNEWLRFDAPGHYRVYLMSGRVVDPGGHRPGFLSFQGCATASNAVELEILPDDPALDARTLQQALPLLNADGYNSRTQDARQAAVRAIRFLGTPEAARAMVARYGHAADTLFWSSPAYMQTRLGLLGFPQPAIVIQEMERRVADPDFPILSLFMEDLAQTQYLAAYPQTVPPFAAADSVKQKERQDLLRLRRSALATMTALDRTQLTAAAPRKQGKARAVSLYTLLQANYAHQGTPEYREEARALVPVFDDLTPEEQNGMLDDAEWAMLRGPDMLPVLRRVFASPSTDMEIGSWQDYETVQSRSLALRRLLDLSPAEGRALLLAEIKSLHPRVDLPTLCSLPDRTLPALDDTLAANLENCLQGRGSSWQIEPRLVQRYATQAILPRVRADYISNGGKWGGDIQSSLLAYFLRTDHAFGLEQMREALAWRKDNGWYRSALSNVTALAPGPDIERLAVLHLHDPDPEVVFDAAKTLGAYGSSAAEAPLWARLREWHGQWTQKASQIEPSDRNQSPMPGQLEYALIQALATAPGWLADRSKLAALESLCVTQEGRGNIAYFLGEWAEPVPITFLGEMDTWQVVQYHSLPSPAALENKLAQFPRGTRFRLVSANYPNRKPAPAEFKRLKSFLEKRGMRMQEEP